MSVVVCAVGEHLQVGYALQSAYFPPWGCFQILVQGGGTRHPQISYEGHHSEHILHISSRWHLEPVGDRLGATPMSVALAWLLQRSPNILLIPGTSKVAHLRENVAGAGLSLTSEDLAELNEISS